MGNPFDRDVRQDTPIRPPDYRTGEDSSAIEIPLFHQILLCPFQILEEQGANGNPASSNLDRWEQLLTTVEWQRASPFFPSDRVEVDAKPLDLESSYSRVRYAEYVYFHPFVRSFLYPEYAAAPSSRASPETQIDDEISSHNDRPCSGDVATARVNRAMRVLKRDDIRWAKIVLPGEKIGEETAFLLRVRRVELYLFEARTGLFVVEFDNRLGPHQGQELRSYDVQVGSERPGDIALGQSADWGDPNQIAREAGVGERTLNLRDVIALQDALRRLYVPYWEFDVYDRHGPFAAGHSVLNVEWWQRKTVVAGTVSIQNAQAADTDATRPVTRTAWSTSIAATRKRGEPALLGWWQQMLSSLVNAKLPIRFLGDDRMGVMVYLAVADQKQADGRTDPASFGPRRIGDADWMRLATQDDPGQPDVFPYSPTIYESSPIGTVREFKQRYAYDRHFCPRPKDDSTPANNEDHVERCLCSGMGFVAATRFHIIKNKSRAERQAELTEILRKQLDTKSTEAKGFGIDPATGLLAHFRYHYFKVGLIVHFHRATLLSFKQELAEATSQFQDVARSDGRRFDKALKGYRERVKDLEIAMLKFRSRYWFTEITSQMQGQELYELWSKHLGTARLLEEVNQQLSKAEQILSREQEDTENELASQLTRVATLFLPFTILAPCAVEIFEAIHGQHPTLSPALWSGGAGIVICFGLFYFVLGRGYLSRRFNDWWTRRWWVADVAAAILTMLALLLCIYKVFQAASSQQSAPSGSQVSGDNTVAESQGSSRKHGDSRTEVTPPSEPVEIVSDTTVPKTGPPDAVQSTPEPKAKVTGPEPGKAAWVLRRRKQH
jgi:hypothetical protein